jgi:hypothetical protein
MANPRKIGGIESFTVTIAGGASKSYAVADGVSVRHSGKARETKNGATGVAGFGETHVAGMISATLFARGDVDVAEFADMEDVTVIVVEKSGKSHVLTGGWTTETPELDAIAGTFPVVFEGPVCEEILA